MREPNFEKEQEQQIVNLLGTALQSQTDAGVGSVLTVCDKVCIAGRSALSG